jgi:hypothetical protein
MILTTDIYNDFIVELKQEIRRIDNRAFNGNSTWGAYNFEQSNSSAITLLENDIKQLNFFQENFEVKLNKDTYETLHGFQEDEIHEIKSKEFEGESEDDLKRFEANKEKEIAFIQTYIDALYETQK